MGVPLDRYLLIGVGVTITGFLWDPDPPRGRSDANAYPRIFWGFMITWIGLIGVLKYYQ